MNILRSPAISTILLALLVAALLVQVRAGDDDEKSKEKEPSGVDENIAENPKDDEQPTLRRSAPHRRLRMFRRHQKRSNMPPQQYPGFEAPYQQDPRRRGGRHRSISISISTERPGRRRADLPMLPQQLPQQYPVADAPRRRGSRHRSISISISTEGRGRRRDYNAISPPQAQPQYPGVQGEGRRRRNRHRNRSISISISIEKRGRRQRSNPPTFPPPVQITPPRQNRRRSPHIIMMRDRSRSSSSSSSEPQEKNIHVRSQNLNKNFNFMRSDSGNSTVSGASAPCCCGITLAGRCGPCNCGNLGCTALVNAATCDLVQTPTCACIATPLTGPPMTCTPICLPGIFAGKV